MTYLVTGSSGHLGEALVRVLRDQGAQVTSVDVKPGRFTDHVGSVNNAALIGRLMPGVRHVLHAATLHKPHVETHTRQDFIDTNISGTQTLLDAAIREGVRSCVFTSTTSTFGDALKPPPGEPAAWITEDVVPQVKNIYGATKLAAEDLCLLAHRKDGLPVLVLRTSRFFPEDQDDKATRDAFPRENAQANEFLNRRVDIEDVVSAHLLAAEKAPEIGFSKYIITATTPFMQDDLAELRNAPGDVLRRRKIDFDTVYQERGWRMQPEMDRVYVNAKARAELGWQPKHNFEDVLKRVASGEQVLSDLARAVGVKGYHDRVFKDGPYPVGEAC
ncbi:MAG: NAD-dependent epimerase [Ponticaulis sp.]|nr:NAD-dependent epimerase [Ponticaulis sp.]|tara:strand:+ start:29192 stop:30184 length:993 start_codon:yes stop_codon:yes gene_type:complete